MALADQLAQGVQFAAPQDPFAQYGKMQQLQAGQTQNALAQYQLGAAQRADQEANALRQSLPADFNPSNPAHINALLRASPVGGAALIEKLAKVKNEALTGQETQSKIDKARRDQFNQMQRDISANPSDAQINAHLEDIMNSSNYSASEKQVAQSKLQGILTLPYEQRFAALASQGATAAELKPGVHGQDTGAGGQLLSTPAFGGAATAIPGSQFTKTMTAGEAARLPIEQGHLAVSQGQLGVAKSNLAVAQQRLQAEMATGNLTPETVDFIAETYRQTGTLPPLGMGPMAAAARSKILTRAGELAMGGGQTAAQAATDVRTSKAENAGMTAGQRAVGTQIANVQVAANEANKMIDVAKPYVAKVNPTDYPALNAAGNYVAKNTGDPNIVGLATSLNAIVNTYARAINPKGTATVSDKNHAREILNAAMSKGQLNEAFNVMNQEMGAALASGPETKAGMRAANAPAAPATTTNIDALLNKYK